MRTKKRAAPEVASHAASTAQAESRRLLETLIDAAYAEEGLALRTWAARKRIRPADIARIAEHQLDFAKVVSEAARALSGRPSDAPRPRRVA